MDWSTFFTVLTAIGLYETLSGLIRLALYRAQERSWGTRSTAALGRAWAQVRRAVLLTYLFVEQGFVTLILSAPLQSEDEE